MVGKIIPNGVLLEEHEYETVLFFTDLGYNVELIPKSNKMGEHTPDIRMNGLLWEMKAPKGEGRFLIPNTIQRAVKQSKNIVIDLRRTKRHQSKCLREIEHEFRKSTSVRRILVIMKSKKLIEFRK